ncbi:MAG: peptide chain release factor N(5)-glutamine methyltransferase [Candidatus Methylomirabilaceae bacterium]
MGLDLTYRRAVERLTLAGVESAPLDAACLLEAAFGVPRWRFVLDPGRPVSRGRPERLESMLSRREAREPVAYILGVKEFWSLPLAVGPRVLIPRPETETLVEAVLDKIGSKARILDVGTGCGAIALALASEFPHARIWATDRSYEALEVARRNAGTLGLERRVHFLGGDLFGPLRTIRDNGGFDLIVSNPPYIPSDALPSLLADVFAYEPHEALDGGPDGLRYYRRIIEATPRFLAEGGWLALEVGDGQARAVRSVIEMAQAFGPAEVRRDLAGRDRVILAPRRIRAIG